MTPQERQSVVWAAIERMAFRPAQDNTWLSLYERTIHQLWELEPGDVVTQCNTRLEVPFLNISCEYRVEQIGKYDVSIRLRGDDSRFPLAFQVDPAYASKASLHNEIRRYRRQDCARHLHNDVASVLDGMVFHPRNHTHLEDCGLTASMQGGQALDAHEIRVGGGIENAFVFLFHLRYQFCLVSEDTRTHEKNRLVALFTSAIEESERNVLPKELFDFKR
jgi:hypothetical protein